MEKSLEHPDQYAQHKERHSGMRLGGISWQNLEFLAQTSFTGLLWHKQARYVALGESMITSLTLHEHSKQKHQTASWYPSPQVDSNTDDR